MKHSETCKHFNGFFERLFILLIKKLSLTFAPVTVGSGRVGHSE